MSTVSYVCIMPNRVVRKFGVLWIQMFGLKILVYHAITLSVGQLVYLVLMKAMHFQVTFDICSMDTGVLPDVYTKA